MEPSAYGTRQSRSASCFCRFAGMNERLTRAALIKSSCAARSAARMSSRPRTFAGSSSSKRVPRSANSRIGASSMGTTVSSDTILARFGQAGTPVHLRYLLPFVFAFTAGGGASGRLLLGLMSIGRGGFGEWGGQQGDVEDFVHVLH